MLLFYIFVEDTNKLMYFSKIYLSVFIFISVAPTWSIGYPWKASFHLFLNLKQSVGLLGQGISPSQGRYLHGTIQIQNKRLECDSNPRSQLSSRRRRFVPYTARPLWSPSKIYSARNLKTLHLLTLVFLPFHKVAQLSCWSWKWLGVERYSDWELLTEFAVFHETRSVIESRGDKKLSHRWQFSETWTPKANKRQLALKPPSNRLCYWTVSVRLEHSEPRHHIIQFWGKNRAASVTLNDNIVQHEKCKLIYILNNDSNAVWSLLH
jgi:hypothetical protein